MKKTALILSLVLLLSLLSSCSKGKTRFQRQSFDCFDTVTTVIGYEQSADAFDAVADRIFAKLEECHRYFDIYQEYDGIANLKTVNASAGDAQGTRVDQVILDLLTFGKEMYGLTGGKVNIAMGSVLEIWHTYRTEGIEDPEKAALPPMSDLEAAAQHTDITDLVIDAENGRVILLDEQMSLDVGAIAKGYAVEIAARELEKDGITGYIISAGGNVRAIGNREGEEKWTAGIEDPQGVEPYLATVSLSGQSLVTSGSYQRYYTVDEKQYHHIIDPDTLMPSSGFVSVSVICKDSGKADALSTALFCMTAEEGVAMVEKIDDVEALWLKDDGTILKTTDFENYCEEDV